MRFLFLFALLFIFPNYVKSEKNAEEMCFKAIIDNDLLGKVKKLCDPQLFLDINFQDSKGATALHYASFINRVDIIQYLIKVGANVQEIDFNLNTPLHVAAKANHGNVIEILLKNKANIEAKEIEENTPLAIAADYNSTEAAQLLIKHRANVNSKSKWRETPFNIAASQGNIAIIKLLYKNKADIYNRNTLSGDNAIDAAAQNNHLEVVRYLLDIGLDINDQKNYKRQPPLMLAIKFYAHETAMFLLSKGANVQISDFINDTPLHYAVYYKNLDVVKKLILLGAKPYVKNNKGKTPYDIAINLRNKNIINILK